MITRRRLFGALLALAAAPTLLRFRPDLGFPHFRGVGRLTNRFDTTTENWITLWEWTDGHRSAGLGFITTARAVVNDPSIYAKQMSAMRVAAEQALTYGDLGAA